MVRYVALTETVNDRSFDLFNQSFAPSSNELAIPKDPLDWQGIKNRAYHLAAQYYEFNEWICGQYEFLLERLEADQRKAIYRRERELLMPIDEVMLDPIDTCLIEWAAKRCDCPSRDAGKALFLDTMGFGNQQIMSGCSDPASSNRKRVEGADRLFPRHHVIARLAREGDCPVIMTTNYDLLLETALQVNGCFRADRTKGEAADFERYVRICSPERFFHFGRAHRSVLLMKIHGCAESYREFRQQFEEDTTTWIQYLNSMVFTYREIQNWRNDAWARDFMRSLQRTRSLIFCGYSLRDPVMHDTFRSVYEEMADVRREPLIDQRDRPTPAVFIGQEDETSFHAVEVLRAADQAVGNQVDNTMEHHDAYLRFNLRHPDQPWNWKFPDYDDIFLYLYHAVIRRRQQRCLSTHLGSLCHRILDRRVSTRRVEAIFARLLAREEKIADPWTNATTCRKACYQLTNWTYYFHAGLLREIVELEHVNRSSSPEDPAREGGYIPFHPNPEAVALGVVIELSLRRHAQEKKAEITAGTNNHPTIVLHELSRSSTRACEYPRALTLITSGRNSLHNLKRDRKNILTREVRTLDKVFENPVGNKISVWSETRPSKPFSTQPAPSFKDLWEMAGLLDLEPREPAHAN
ncbi:MAG: SIR2 family protein [Verrucomicrobiota bacterium]